MKNNCNLVIDLLPTYIEKRTSQETNEFVEKHIENCEECKKVYLDMLSNIEKEDIENTEIVKEIKKYKTKILILKLFAGLIVLCTLLIFIKNISFKFNIVNKSLKKNINYDLGDNYTIEEYEDSIERYENHITTYYLEGKMKKVYGDKLLEYYDGEFHYYFDDENKTYYVEKVELNDNLNIDIQIFKTDNFNNNFVDILKFILLDKNIIIQKEGFRDKEYYIIKDIYGSRVYLDKETFIAERVEKSREYKKEYRVIQANVNYRMVEAPNFSLYTKIEK